ncbi:MAG: hypothetical protein KDB18_10425, partial [Salinibacterium sp.]|nr:hypothetical protein [Salinibacterium sp.]
AVSFRQRVSFTMTQPGDANNGPMRAITWAGLLARWTDFAQASLALPDDADGNAWKASVPSIIELQAVTHALGELDELEDDDRPAAIDRAEVTCQKAARELYRVWDNQPPQQIEEIIDDARAMFEAASNAGVEWLAASDQLTVPPAAALMAKLAPLKFQGDVFLATPGYPLLRGTPAAFARAPGGAPPRPDVLKAIARFLTTEGGKVSEPGRVASPRQVYRRSDFATGKLANDLVVPMTQPPVAGQPLLLLAIESGRLIAPAMPTRGMASATAAVPPGVDFAPDDPESHDSHG